ncbi:hypothetical protein BX600DRAFT_508025 [Xylariales sp. PMI_506]|nr:hypothetical protein BX600DRAFT_508025 [Xylariales sp. PMI_506]
MAHDLASSGNGGEGSSRSGARNSHSSQTLADVMRAPSANAPGVIVLDSTHDDKGRKEILNPHEDLWLSSADGRYNSPIVPLQVGVAPNAQTFYVHRDILVKAEYFRKALCGEFKEAEAQAIELPEESPAIFHFIVAFLYEDRYVPIKPIAAALTRDEKGKSLEIGDDSTASDSESSIIGAEALSDSSSTRSRRRRARRRRRENRQWERLRQKHPGVHRLGCGCRQCLSGGGPPCWHCLAPRVPPPPQAPAGHIHQPVVVIETERPRIRHDRHRDRHRFASPPPLGPTLSSGNRIKGEDLRTWLITYELNLDVYICANKFLLENFKVAIARVCIDMLESAGADAAQPEVLQMCFKLYEGLPEWDALMKMIFARVGFLQPLLWRNAPQETSEFLLSHPEVSALILKETVYRREQDHGLNQLPAMERPYLPPPLDSPYGRPPPPGHRPRW